MNAGENFVRHYREKNDSSIDNLFKEKISISASTKNERRELLIYILS